MKKNLQIAVIGAGLMGHGIALTLARAGQYVAITDPMPDARAALPGRITESLRLMGEPDESIAKILKRIEIFDSIPGAVKGAFAVFEAAPERMPLKQAIFAEVEAHAPAGSILASNTSVMPITQIMGGLKRPERALGTHWWNPPHMIPLVEVIRTEWTAPDVAQTMMNLLEDAGKTPVMVEKDVPGFIGNRLQHALWREAISLVERGICDAEAVDTVVKSCFADLVGTDLTLDIHETVLADLEHRPGPSPYLQKLVDSGKLGMKSGQGFRVWTEEEAAKTRLEGILPND